MRAFEKHFIVFVLALVLVSTTPTGTGSGVHQFDLLHPLFSHIHIVNGQVLTHEQLEQAGPAALRVAGGSAIGAAGGPGPGDGGAGLSPTLVPRTGLVAGPLWRWVTLVRRLPTGLVETPPDPPPTSAA